MNNKVSKKVAIFAGLLAIVVAFSSCNRGYGCPYNTSVSNVVKVINFSVFE